ncbi:DUF1501 domain-containing protein [Lignipirellula cremea]|uniref:Sulfatase n=1 Tax=Lignipirellula cremea TaxID=2528010 RepID=A0A518DY62_9BACT|nr:DUF1501 domain-containing protein [Lignipirellula cremea]QDU96741.1 hypothetical protein Pla8534_45620 [Lignipirellula cremea]
MTTPFPVTRRQWLTRSGGAFGSLALAGLLARDGLLGGETNGQKDDAQGPVDQAALAAAVQAQAPHFAPRAKNVIFLFMYGGPSHVDLFDPKPTLDKYHEKEIPVFRKQDAFMGKTRPFAMKSPFKFGRHGEAGLDICELYPSLAKQADKLCVIRSMHCESNNHGPALFQMQSGSLLSGHPSVGSWVNYGLGSECDDLPGFVVMMDHQGAPVNGALNWSNGFIPASYQGVPLRTTGEPIAYLRPPAGVTRERQRAQLDLLSKWNQQYADQNPAEEALESRIASYELAYRMQTRAPEAVDLGQETAATRTLYGLDNPVSQYFGRNCLLARRLVERGVRFVQLYSGGNQGPRAWDAHDDLEKNHRLHCSETDQPIAALLADLEQRGLLDTTLVVWGGEFGRTPTFEGGKGRDHHALGFTMWMAGGGVRGGMTYGATDEFGYHAVENPVSVPDLHATILHQLGIHHEQLTYRFQGRDYRLTDVSGRVIRELLA